MNTNKIITENVFFENLFENANVSFVKYNSSVICSSKTVSSLSAFR